MLVGAGPLVVTAAAAEPLFPPTVDEAYAARGFRQARMQTCLDQYYRNKATDSNGGLSWIAPGGGYYAACRARFPAPKASPTR